MSQSLVIFGCGGQGREIAAIALSAGQVSGNGLALLGFLDDSPSPEDVNRAEDLGLTVIGPSSVVSDLPEGLAFVVGIADGAVRQRLALLAEQHGLEPATLQHPDATIGPACRLGPGTVVWPGARLSTNVRLGRHVHVNQNVTIGHDTDVLDFAAINPSAAISGNVVLGQRSLVGAGAVVLQGRRVGDDAVVGASACVTRDVPPATVVKGVPAR